MLYDQIGHTYSATRREDPRFKAAIENALGDWELLLNVGAGSGNYEPQHSVVAAEPSTTMIRQRRSDHPVVQAAAERLPFRTGAFDVAMALSTVHHWTDATQGLTEMRRVSAKQIVLYYEPLDDHGFWPFEYFGAEPRSSRPHHEVVHDVLHVVETRHLHVPHDCEDAAGAAFWNRPEQYLDPANQAGMSWIARLTPEARAAASQRLAADLASGKWDRRYGHLRELREFDVGYRIAIAGAPDTSSS